MKTQKYVLIALPFVLMLTSCSGNEPDITAQQKGKTWVLTTYNDIQPIDSHQPILEFYAGQVSGTTGCNHYGGTYQIDGDSIRFEGVYNTEMACLEPEGLMDQERVYLELFWVADQFELNEGLLTFYSASNPILVFETQSEAQQSVEPILEPTEPVAVEVVPTPTSVSLFVPPEGFTPYQDHVTGISVYVPETWIVTGIVEGEYAILQSYPEDKCIGGEMLAEGDTKCELNIQLSGTQIDDFVSQWKSDGITTILSEEEFQFPDGVIGKRFEIDSMGRSKAYIAEIGGRDVLLTCFGDLSEIDQIAETLQVIR